MYNDYSLGGPKSPYISHKAESARSPLHSSQAHAYNVPTQCSFDLLNGRVEHLESERVNLSLQIQEQSEKDRTRKIRIEQLESDLRSGQIVQTNLRAVNEESQDKLRALREGKEELMNVIINLNERIESQTKEASNAQNLWSKMTAASRELKRLEEEALKSRREKAEMEAEKEETEADMAKLREINERRQEEMTLLRLEIEGQRRTFKDSKTALESANASISSELIAAKSVLLDATESSDRDKERFYSEQSNLLGEIDELRRLLETRPEESSPTDDSEKEEKMTSAAIEDLKKKLLLSEMQRKQLHNTLQELRGNIRVFIRCRPFLHGDGDEHTTSSENTDPNVGGCVKFHKDGNSVSLLGLATASNRGTPQVFSFDQVFKCESSQDEVFKEVSDLVQSALDGYKVCIFSYGQTGSGKTHTMTGDKEGDMRGIIPRSVEQIIEQVMLMRSNGWEVVVTTSMVEIYNEDLRDLLSSASTPTTSIEKEKAKLKISNLQGYVTISGLVSVELNTQDMRSGMKQLEGLLDRAAKSRMTACTAMNERSSRSHALFMLDINARHSDGTTYLRGGLRLCDLAGSERLDRTGTANDATRLKETVNINKSLSCLADVFVSLGNKAAHIPYRNSKLTMVLQDCLSGDGKALMFVNVSPTTNSLPETLCSLRFASQVNQVELGKATKSVYTIPIQLQPQAVVAPTPAPASSGASSGAVRGTARLIGAKRSNAQRTPCASEKSEQSEKSSSNVPFSSMGGPATRDSPGMFSAQQLNSSFEASAAHLSKRSCRQSILCTASLAASMPNTSGKTGLWR